MIPDLPERVAALSRALAQSTAAAAEQADPALSPAFAEVGTGTAVFCGDGSPLTQCAWLGFGAPHASEQLDEVERFYAGRADSWEYVVTPFCDPSLVAAVVRRGWTHVQYESVMVAQVASIQSAQDGFEGVVEEVGAERREEWSELSTQIFFGGDVPPTCANLATIISASPGTTAFWALIDGVPVATASLAVAGSACYLGGAATLPEYRGRGAQGALLSRRLAVAQALGCDLAVCECLPGSQSQRNQERSGFKVAYTKLVFTREA